jgi:hypothetical protein
VHRPFCVLVSLETLAARGFLLACFSIDRCKWKPFDGFFIVTLTTPTLSKAQKAPKHDMRICGRRVALLLASALPLLANEAPIVPTETAAGVADTAVADTTTHSAQQYQQEASTTISASQPQHDVLVDPDENDEDPASVTASEAIHNEDFKLPSLAKTEKASATSSESSETKGNIGNDSEGSEASMGANESPVVEDQNQESEKRDPGTTEVSDEVESSSDDAGDATTSDAADANNSSIEQLGGSLRNETIDESNENQHLPPEEEVASTTTEPEAAADKQNEAAVPEKEDSSEENPKESDTDEDDEEDSLSRVSVDYASKSAGALIIEKSSSFKGTSNLLNGDKDKYAITPCEDKKFVVMSLSEEILVKQIKLANYERFSSSVKDFQVMGSQTLGKWFDLGTYSAESGNGEQTFDLLEPAWARYLKFKFLSHNGVEYYCTFSQIKVHGSTMVQGFHEQWEESENEDNEMEELGNMDENVESDILVETQGNPSTEDDKTQGEGSTTAVVDDTTSGASATEESKEKNTNDKINANEEEIIETSVESKQTGCVVASTCPLVSSTELNEKLNGALTDEELFSSLYDLIPSTLNALPKVSRESPGRQTAGGELRTLHQIGSLAMQSLYSTSKLASDAAKALISNNSSDAISTPKMADRMGDAISQYLGTDLGLLSGIWDGHAVEVSTVNTADKIVEMTTNHTEQTENETSNLNSGERVALLKDTTASSSSKPVKDESGPTDRKAGTQTTENHKDVVQTNEALNPSTPSLEPPMDLGIAKMLENLPSAECLSKLDFSHFKAKINASKKAHNGLGSSTASGSSPMEPIFKKLTDEIKLLQGSLAIHDQFTKTSVACYQRVLLDLIVDTERLRTDHEERLLNLENQFRASRATSLWNIVCSIFGGMRMATMWIYSGAIYIYSPLLTWLSALFKVSLRIPGILYRHFLHRWPAIKNALLTNVAGSSKLAKYIRPFTDQMDQLVVEMEIADSNHGPEDSDDEMWKFPVLPILLLILLGRLVMCFASPSLRTTTLPSRRELIALKEKAWSPSRIGKQTPTAKPLPTTPSGLEKRTEDITTTPTQPDTPPPLVSEAGPGEKDRPSPKDKASRIPQPGRGDRPPAHRERSSPQNNQASRIPQFGQQPRAAANHSDTPSKAVTP